MKADQFRKLNRTEFSGRPVNYPADYISKYSIFKCIVKYLLLPEVLFFLAFAGSTSYAVEEKPTNGDLMNRLFCHAPHIGPPTGKGNAQQILHWRKVYSEQDIEYDKKLIRYKKEKGLELMTSYQKLVEGWYRLVYSGHLKMVYNLCKEEDIPLEIVFLAMAESSWNNKAQSAAGAKGYWQFMPSTARSYGLIDDTENMDYRSNPVKSTEAAIKLLKDNYNLTLMWDRAYKINGKKVKNSDRWLWAFWAYNRSPKSVAPYYKRFQGDPAPYSESVDNTENANYVHKIFAIRAVLRDYVLAIKADGSLLKKKKMSKGDELLGQYKQNWYKMELPERLFMLTEIRNQYLARHLSNHPGVSATNKKSATPIVELSGTPKSAKLAKSTRIVTAAGKKQQQKAPVVPQMVTREIWYLKEVLSAINYDVAPEKQVSAASIGKQEE
ncbi:MAG: transglycosylase SLT domain-containing protein [Nitrospirae bacterium]|nr:transglycosylase SLT domain-containing protein [Nitrospirota bacterium]